MVKPNVNFFKTINSKKKKTDLGTSRSGCPYHHHHHQAPPPHHPQPRPLVKPCPSSLCTEVHCRFPPLLLHSSFFLQSRRSWRQTHHQSPDIATLGQIFTHA